MVGRELAALVRSQLRPLVVLHLGVAIQRNSVGAGLHDEEVLGLSRAFPLLRFFGSFGQSSGQARRQSHSFGAHWPEQGQAALLHSLLYIVLDRRVIKDLHVTGTTIHHGAFLPV